MSKGFKRCVALVFCVSVAEIPAWEMIPAGVEKINCAGCGDPVYSTQGTRDLIASGRAQPACNACTEKYLEGLTEEPIPAMTVAQLLEAEEMHRAADRN